MFAALFSLLTLCQLAKGDQYDVGFAYPLQYTDGATGYMEIFSPDGRSMYTIHSITSFIEIRNVNGSPGNTNYNPGAIVRYVVTSGPGRNRVEIMDNLNDEWMGLAVESFIFKKVRGNPSGVLTKRENILLTGLNHSRFTTRHSCQRLIREKDNRRVVYWGLLGKNAEVKQLAGEVWDLWVANKFQYYLHEEDYKRLIFQLL